MNTIYLILFVSTLTMLSSMIGVLTLVSHTHAQTPTTSDLPATIGNESFSDMGLTNDTVPVENTTTIISVPPP
jgi:hypothetical protein